MIMSTITCHELLRRGKERSSRTTTGPAQANRGRDAPLRRAGEETGSGGLGKEGYFPPDVFQLMFSGIFQFQVRGQTNFAEWRDAWVLDWDSPCAAHPTTTVHPARSHLQ